MGFSKFLLDNKSKCLELVELLGKDYKYVSVLGSDVKGVTIVANKNTSSIGENSFDKQLGFVVKMSSGRAFYEYSFDSFSEDVPSLVKRIKESLKVDASLLNKEVFTKDVEEEKIVKDFIRESDFSNYSNEELLNFTKELVNKTLKKDTHLVNVNCSIQTFDVSKMFISKNKVLTQNYTWVYSSLIGFYLGDNSKMAVSRVGANSHLLKDAINELPTKIDELVSTSQHLSNAKSIVPGVYDVITHPTITGLIAHEAFGHGVEMDQFVKDRALAKKMVGEYVASPLVNMKDGPSSCFSVSSYFFDDDGVLATDTQIIKDGILVTGICDLVSSRELDCPPTSNSKRESFKRKAYTRMTNTFFEKGNDKLEDMIKSIKHGYMLYQTNNGMEDPKSWAIQCVCQYGREIIDGKLTDNYVSPVVMSGFVPDLLKSISMVSDEVEIEGAGACGKGYKEWVRVSDGGPYLKAKVKLS